MGGACVHICMYVCIYIYVCVYVRTYVCVYKYTYIHIFIYTYIHNADRRVDTGSNLVTISIEIQEVSILIVTNICRPAGGHRFCGRTTSCISILIVTNFLSPFCSGASTTPQGTCSY